MRTSSLFVVGIVSVVLCGCGDGDEAAVDAGPGADGGADAAASDGAPGGICGGFAGAKCDADEYCDYASNDCGATDGVGTCVQRPTGCPDPVAEPTCGCDGTVYNIPCDAYFAGTDLNALGGCTIEAGNFACGWTQCLISGEYCEHQVSDVAGVPDDYACRALPACPGPPSCACVDGLPCSDMCTGNGQTGLTLTCPGG